MAIRKYRDFVLVASAVEKDEKGVEQFSVEVFASPRGGGLRVAKRKIPSDLRKRLGRLERRKLGVDGVIDLGETLAELLLPGEVRELFKGCLDMLKPGQGLRLRLRLDPALADIPWEYIYVPRAGGERDSTGFLVLDPRVSIARHEAMPIPGDFDATPKKRRLLVALASPKGEDPLDLDKERDNLKEALRDVPGIDLDLLENATIQTLGDELLPGADIFHFAGHGTFGQTGLGERFRTAEGEGAIVLVAEDGKGAPMPAEELAINLRGRGVQLVVLGACQTGRRGQRNVWSSVAAALMKAGIPAAVAMQYGIWDDAAIAFNRSFYRVLAAGLPLDYAVSAGRLAAFNRCHPVREDPELGKCWRDWGVPVLYLRSDQDFVLPAIEDADRREAVTRKAKAEAERREREVAADQPPAAPAEEVVAPGLVEKGIPAPALTGKSFSEAEDLCRKAGVAVRAAARRYHSSAPLNAVIEQSPEAGTPVNAGAVIEVVLSKGPEIAPVVVPDVTGKTLEQAEAAVEALGFNLEIDARRYDAAAAVETVIQQRPWPGETIKPGATVSVVVSRGPKAARAGPSRKRRRLVFSALAAAVVLAILALAGVFSPGNKVPDVIGFPEYEAAADLHGEGFLVKVEPAASEDVPRGHVIGTHPPASEKVAEDNTITLVVSTGPPPKDAGAYYNRGNALLELGEYKEAIESYDKAIEITPKYAWAYVGRGNALLEFGEYKEAIESYDKAIEITPKYAWAYVGRGNTLVELEKYEEAIKSYDKAIEIDPKHAWGYWGRSNALFRLGKYEEAIKSCDKAIEIDPECAGAYSNRGAALRELGEYEEAIKSCDKAIEIDPAFALAHYNRGDTLYRLRKYEEAIKSCDKAIEFDPAYALSHYNRGLALYMLGEYEEAIKSYDKTIGINPEYANAYYYKGVALEKLGRTDEAFEYYKKAHELDERLEIP